VFELDGPLQVLAQIVECLQRHGRPIGGRDVCDRSEYGIIPVRGVRTHLR